MKKNKRSISPFIVIFFLILVATVLFFIERHVTFLSSGDSKVEDLLVTPTQDLAETITNDLKKNPITAMTTLESGNLSTVEITSVMKDKDTQKEVPFDIKLTVPKSWKVHSIDSSNSTDEWGNSIATLNLGYPFAAYQYSGGNFFITDFTTWLKTNENDRDLTTSDKSQFIKYLMNYNEKSIFKREPKERFLQLFNMECLEAPIQTKKITAMNNKLSGLTSIGFSTQSFEATPIVSACLAGYVNNHLIFVMGRFDLKDKKAMELQKILTEQKYENPETREATNNLGTQQAIEEARKKLPDDDQAMWNQFQEVMKSMQIH